MGFDVPRNWDCEVYYDLFLQEMVEDKAAFCFKAIRKTKSFEQKTFESHQGFHRY
jgi:hypothetical protein